MAPSSFYDRSRSNLLRYMLTIQEKQKVLYIIGTGHCGSTMLALCCGRNEKIASVSELIRLDKERNWDGLAECLRQPEWQVVDQSLRNTMGKGLSEMSLALKPWSITESSIKENEELYRQIALAFHRDVVVDASKDGKRILALAKSQRLDLYVLYLVRDGRAIISSYNRKYLSIWHGLRRVGITEALALSARVRFGKKRFVTMQYEEFAEEPAEFLKRLCLFVGVKYEDKMSRPDTRFFKGIGGNRLLKRDVSGIVKDEKWKNRLSDRQKLFLSLILLPYHVIRGYRIFVAKS